MDKPADPATPFREVYQPFLDDLAMHGRKPATIDRYRYTTSSASRIGSRRPSAQPSSPRWGRQSCSGIASTSRRSRSSPRGSTRRGRGGLMSSHTVHSYLRSIKCLASWLLGSGYILTNPFLATNPYYKNEGVMPVLRPDDRVPKVGSPSDVAISSPVARVTDPRTSAIGPSSI